MSLDSDRVKAKMAEFLNLPTTRFEDATILTHLVAESFLLIQLVMELQDEFDIRLMQADLQPVQTVGDLVELVVRRASDH